VPKSTHELQRITAHSPYSKQFKEHGHGTSVSFKGHSTELKNFCHSSFITANSCPQWRITDGQH